MIHKTISAANELRGARRPMAEGNVPNLWIIRVWPETRKTPAHDASCGVSGGEWKLFAWTLCASPRETT